MDRIIFAFGITVFILGSLGCSSRPESESRQLVEETVAEPAPERESIENGILFFGDSITAGLGVESDQAFPALIEERIDSLGWNFDVVPAGLSGETSAGGLRRIGWVMQEEIDVLVLELGGNDGLRGIDPAVIKKNLAAIIDTARSINPDVRVILAGMRLPPNLGQEYTQEFHSIYSELAAEKDLVLIPFILKGVGGVPELMQADGIHPTAEGHEVIAQTVWEYLKPVLQELRREEQMAVADAEVQGAGV